MTAHTSFLIALAVVVAASAAVGTTPHPRLQVPATVGTDQGSAGRVVTGAPYSADSVVTTTLTTFGSPVEMRVVARVYRDSAGRIRREQVPGGLDVPTPADRDDLVVIIVDTVAGVVYSLNPATRTAYRMPSGQSPNAVATIPQPASPFSEALGTSTMEGISVTGRRAVTTLPPGTDGRPVEIVDERWESPALGIAVLERHRDSRTGVFEHRLTNLSRNEPPAALFAVPATYTIVDVVAAAR